jgi:hypothetical protein
LQKRTEKRPRAAGPELVTEVTDKNHTMSETPDSNLNVSSPQVKKKRKQKKPSLGGQNLYADFQSYLYKNLDRMAMEHPEWNPTTVEQYLRREWNEMDDLLKLK